jgi:cytochrome c oxidase assembly protein subunit 15
MAPARLRFGALTLAALLLFQIYLGALVAGLDAGIVFNTWPLIDGTFVPSSERLWFVQPTWRNLFENTLTVQFNHRMVAYAIWALASCTPAMPGAAAGLACSILPARSCRLCWGL